MPAVSIVSNSPYGIIKDAMMDAGLLQQGDDPNSEELAIFMRRLCDIINLWQTQGLKLFLQKEITIPLIAGTYSYTVNQAVGVVPNKNLRVLQGRVQTPQGTVRTINAISWDEWNRLTKNVSGAVTGYLVDKQVSSLVVNVWNTPDATEALNSMILLVQTQADNPVNLEAQVLFPQEWRIALRWGLADDICTGQPDTIMQRCAQKASIFKEMLDGWDVEDTQTRFAVDFSPGYSGRSFR